MNKNLKIFSFSKILPTEAVIEEIEANQENVQDLATVASAKRSVKSATNENLIHVHDQRVTQGVHRHAKKHPQRSEVVQVVRLKESSRKSPRSVSEIMMLKRRLEWTIMDARRQARSLTTWTFHHKNFFELYFFFHKDFLEVLNKKFSFKKLYRHELL